MNAKKIYFYCLIALLLGLAIGFGLKPREGLTTLGVSLPAANIPTLYL